MADEIDDEIDVEGFDDKEGSSSTTLLPNDATTLNEEYKHESSIRSQIWNELGVPVCDWPVDGMDEESRLTIENMLHEERRYLGSSNEPASKRSKKKSSPYLRWTPQERLQFESGYMSYGNRWTQIANMIPTRSPLQVKNYARYYFPAKAKSMSGSADVNNWNPINQDVIHSHLPETLNTGSPTVPTRLKLPNMRHIPHPSKRRHFQKFGFANLSSCRLLKARSGKDALASRKLSKDRSAQRKKTSVEGCKTPWKRKTRRMNQAKGQRVRTKINEESPQEQGSSRRDESRDVTGGSSVDLFKQGGGVIRMRPESSEDEDVDVEDDAVRDEDKHQESSLMGLAATCDRIYSNLIMPSFKPAPPTKSRRDIGEEGTHLKPKTKIVSEIPDGSKVKDHRVMQELLVVPELPWNADHTYSMSLKALHKLGILRQVSSEPQEQTETAAVSYGVKDLTRSAHSSSASETKTVIRGDPGDISGEKKTFSLKSEPVDSSDACPEDDDISVGCGTDPDVSDVLVPQSEPTACHVKDEPCDECSVNTSALVQEDIGQLMDMCQHIETFLSKGQDPAVPETPLSSTCYPVLESTDTLSVVTGPYQEHRVEGCVISETDEPIPQLTTTEAPLENNPVIPGNQSDSDCEVGGSSHEDENRSVTEDDEKETSDAAQGEADSNGGGDSEQITEPTREYHLELDEIEDWEKRANPEFFEGRPTKTPERYLKIRNYIYQYWLETKPKYVNKAAVRPGLKNCGDVNSIGHIHHSLEVAGVINFGLENPHRAVIDCRANAIRHRKATNSNHGDHQKARKESQRVRKKKVFDPEPEISQKSEEKPPARKSVRSGPRKSKAVAYDPFKLIECCRFTEEKEAPFHVQIQSDAMIIMDVHSHMSSTEVIGLLGGKFLKEDSVLDVLQAVPCNSISTGMQCEMDPVSQTEAYESILAKGYQVVGWYHSHPAFAANPSVRDIETQSEFQGWFSQGGAPFIGVIISPCHNYQISQSRVCCLTISKEWSLELKCRKPYKFDFTVSHSHCDNVHTMNTISSVASKFAVYQYRSEMLYLWSRHYDISFLEKMLLSIKTYICPSQQGDLLKQIKDFITAEFTTKTIDTMEEEDDN